MTIILELFIGHLFCTTSCPHIMYRIRKACQAEKMDQQACQYAGTWWTMQHVDHTTLCCPQQLDTHAHIIIIAVVVVIVQLQYVITRAMWHVAPAALVNEGTRDESVVRCALCTSICPPCTIHHVCSLIITHTATFYNTTTGPPVRELVYAAVGVIAVALYYKGQQHGLCGYITCRHPVSGCVYHNTPTYTQVQVVVTHNERVSQRSSSTPWCR